MQVQQEEEIKGKMMEKLHNAFKRVSRVVGENEVENHVALSHQRSNNLLLKKNNKERKSNNLDFYPIMLKFV